MSDLAIFDEQPTSFLVGRQPSWIVRRGIMLIFVVIAALFILTWFISYPDTIYSQITITTARPPVEMISKVDGRIIELYVKNNEPVKQKQPLFLIKSLVNFENLKRLELKLESLKKSLDLSSIESFDISELNIKELGSIQTAVNQLFLDLKKLALNKTSTQFLVQSENFELLARQYHSVQQQLRKKRKTWEKKLAIDFELLQKKKNLVEKGVLTGFDISSLKNRYLDKQLAVEGIDIQIELYDVKISELTQNLTNSKIQRSESLKQLMTTAYASYYSLINNINRWKQEHLYLAPIDGQASFSLFWSTNQYVKKGDVVMRIANQFQDIIGKIQIGQIGTGKIKVGQRVDIELASFPGIQYGQVVGKVKAISLVPGVRGYLIDVVLPNELVTTYGKQLPFSPNLIGRAKIITDKKRLFERFFSKILYVFN